MKINFRKTPIGYLPVDWKIQTIKESEFDISDGNYSSKYPKSTDFVSHGIPFIRANNLNNGRIVWNDMRFISQAQHADLRKGHLKANDILVTTRGEIGQVALVDNDFVDCNINAQLVRINTREKVITEFLFYYLMSSVCQKQFKSLKTGTALMQLPVKSLNKLVFALPPLPEQRKIAEIHSTVDEAIEKTDAIIEETRQLKKGLMQKLFTEGIGHTRFKDTKIGRIPEEWEIPKLQIICMNVVDCPHTSPKLVEDGYVVVKNFNIRDGRLVLQPKFYTSEEEYYERTSRLKPQAGDVLFSREAPIGEACLVPPDLPLSLGQRMMLFRVNTTLMDKRFLVYSLYARAVRNYMLAISHGVTVKHLNVADVRKLLIPKPSLQEQIQIANILEEIDGKIDNEVAYKEELELLKKGLMQVLLTGKVRVKIADAEEMIHEV